MSEATSHDHRAGILRLFDRLLRRPENALAGLTGEARGPLLVKLLLGAVLCCAAYGLAAGFFQGGDQVLVTALKAPLVVLASLGLCLPSLYVFGSLAAGEVPAGRIVAAAVGFAALLGLLLAGLIPIVWLFSISSRSLAFLVTLHVFLWLLVLGLAFRVLKLAFPERPARRVVGLWLVLLLIVSLQVTTTVRPVLWRPAGAPVFDGGRLFFLEHFGQILKDDARIRRAQRAVNR